MGTLYEACDQVNDALDAYQRAADLDPKNLQITLRLQQLRQNQANGTLSSAANGNAAAASLLQQLPGGGSGGGGGAQQSTTTSQLPAPINGIPQMKTEELTLPPVVDAPLPAAPPPPPTTTTTTSTAVKRTLSDEDKGGEEVVKEAEDVSKRAKTEVPSPVDVQPVATAAPAATVDAPSEAAAETAPAPTDGPAAVAEPPKEDDA